MRTQTTSKVIVYHDETEIRPLKGHVLLFIPHNLTIRDKATLWGTLTNDVKCRELIYDKIMEIRKNHGALEHKFEFSEKKSKKWVEKDIAEREMVDLGADALRRKSPQKFNATLCCKLGIIYYSVSRRLDLYGGNHKEKILRYAEKLLGMLLKGAVHLLYDENNQVEILKIITDGMPYHRKISVDRVLKRLTPGEQAEISSLRPYVKILDNAEIIPLSSDHRKYEPDSEEYIDANMLQLADMLLGSVNHSCFEEAVISPSIPPISSKITNKKGIVAYPVKEMLDKKEKRKAGFIHSSHYKSFTLSKAIPQNDGSWRFEKITAKEVKSHADVNQLRLVDCTTK